MARAPRPRRKTRLAIVADLPNWAFANIARNMTRVLADHADVTTIFTHGLSRAEVFSKLYIEGPLPFDHVHFLWRENLCQPLQSFELFMRLIRKIRELDQGIGFERRLATFARRFAETATTLAISDHLFLDPPSVSKREFAFSIIDGYSTLSIRLARLCATAYGYAPLAITRDAVDPELFRPTDLERFDRFERPLVVGWAGNSKWLSENGGDPKGLATILEPALSVLAARGVEFIADFADRNTRWRAIDEMPAYYAGIDVLVCASEIEGTPMPILEAMSCGAAVVSTDVGVTREVFGPLQSRFIVARSPEAVADALGTLARDRALLKALSAENLTAVAGWTWGNREADWLELMRSARLARDGGAGRARATLVRMGIEADAALRAKRASSDTPAPRGAIATALARLTGWA
jgi:glycosyltransferase involved in cell wall biosynthesis